MKSPKQITRTDFIKEINNHSFWAMTANELADFFESFVGIEFISEEKELSAVEKFNASLSNHEKNSNTGKFWLEILNIAVLMRDELQAENKQLKSELKERYEQIGNLQGEVGDALMKIERLKQSIIESPELEKARSAYNVRSDYNGGNQLLPWRVTGYIRALESELEKLRNRG